MTQTQPTQRSLYLYGRAGELATELDKRGYRTQKIIALILGEFAEKFTTTEEAVAACQSLYQTWAVAHPDKQ